MKPEAARLLVEEMKRAGIDFVVTLPDSGFRQVYEEVQKDPQIRFVPVCSEGEGVNLCAGAWLGGRRPVMMMENSGLRVASEWLARLGISFGLPVLLLMSYRGDTGDGNWWAVNHGVVMEPMLQALRIPYRVIRDLASIPGCLSRAWKSLQASKYHVAVVMGGETLW